MQPPGLGRHAGGAMDGRAFRQAGVPVGGGQILKQARPCRHRGGRLRWLCQQWQGLNDFESLVDSRIRVNCLCHTALITREPAGLFQLFYVRFSGDFRSSRDFLRNNP
jgi:hypothetical protein